MNTDHVASYALDFLNKIDELVYILDENFCIITVNEAASNHLLDSRENAIGNSCADICTFRRMNPNGPCPVAVAKETKSKVTIERTNPDGKSWLTKVYPMFQDDKIIGFVEIKSDITDRKMMKEKLVLSERRYHDLIETSNDIFWEIDLNFNYQYVSQRAYDILGYHKNDILGKNISDFTTSKESDKLIQFLRTNLLSGDSFYNYERRIIHKNGFEFWFSTSGIPIIDLTGKIIGYRGTDRDITSNKKALELQKMAYSQIDRNIQQYAKLVDGIKNPLSVILGLIELNMQDYQDELVKQVEKIISITNQMSIRWLESEQFRNILKEHLLKS